MRPGWPATAATLALLLVGGFLWLQPSLKAAEPESEELQPRPKGTPKWDAFFDVLRNETAAAQGKVRMLLAVHVVHAHG